MHQVCGLSFCAVQTQCRVRTGHFQCFVQLPSAWWTWPCHRMMSSKLSGLLNFNSDACHLWIVPHCSAHQGNCRHQFFSSLETSPYLLLRVISVKHNQGSTTTTLICCMLLSTFFWVATASHHLSAQHCTKNIMYTLKIDNIYIIYGTVSKNMFISFVNRFHFWFCKVWLTSHPSLIIILL